MHVKYYVNRPKYEGYLTIYISLHICELNLMVSDLQFKDMVKIDIPISYDFSFPSASNISKSFDSLT